MVVQLTKIAKRDFFYDDTYLFFKKLYVEMVKQIMESTAMNDENAE